MQLQRRSGSITVFAALSIMLVAQLLFTLLEAARNIEFYKVLQMNTESVLESTFADYASPLWENYHLLGLTAQDGDGDFSLVNREAMLRNLSQDNLGSQTDGVLSFAGNSMLTADMTDVRFSSYLLMTDQQGKVFQAAVTSYMKNNLVYEAAQTLYSDYETAKEMTDQYGDGDASIDDAIDALESLKEEEEESSGSSVKSASRMSLKGASADDTDSTEASSDNLLTTVAETKKTGILTLVLPQSASISGAKMNLEQTVSHRQLESGSGGRQVEDDWYDQVLMNQYFVNYLSDYTDGEDNRGLNYELEYLIGGKAEDSANLKAAVTEILALREAANLATAVGSAQKQSQAMQMAVLLAGATANPVIIEAVKYGILAAWAYVESVLDLRTLLQGGKIALVKSDADWTSDLDSLSELLSGWSQAKSSSSGVSYTDYLRMLLFFHSSESLAMRAMDVQEATVRQTQGYEDFRMDCLICEADLYAEYEYVPVFTGFVTLLNQKTDRFGISRTAHYSYLDQS